MKIKHNFTFVTSLLFFLGVGITGANAEVYAVKVTCTFVENQNKQDCAYQVTCGKTNYCMDHAPDGAINTPAKAGTTSAAISLSQLEPNKEYEFNLGEIPFKKMTDGKTSADIQSPCHYEVDKNGVQEIYSLSVSLKDDCFGDSGQGGEGNNGKRPRGMIAGEISNDHEQDYTAPAETTTISGHNGAITYDAKGKEISNTSSSNNGISTTSDPSGKALTTTVTGQSGSTTYSPSGADISTTVAGRNGISTTTDASGKLFTTIKSSNGISTTTENTGSSILDGVQVNLPHLKSKNTLYNGPLQACAGVLVCEDNSGKTKPQNIICPNSGNICPSVEGCMLRKEDKNRRPIIRGMQTATPTTWTPNDARVTSLAMVYSDNPIQKNRIGRPKKNQPINQGLCFSLDGRTATSGQFGCTDWRRNSCLSTTPASVGDFFTGAANDTKVPADQSAISTKAQ